jgi:hypothetical protein
MDPTFSSTPGRVWWDVEHERADYGSRRVFLLDLSFSPFFLSDFSIERTAGWMVVDVCVISCIPFPLSLSVFLIASVIRNVPFVLEL